MTNQSSKITITGVSYVTQAMIATQVDDFTPKEGVLEQTNALLREL